MSLVTLPCLFLILCVWVSFLCLLSLATGLSILCIYSKKQLLILLIFPIVFLVSISFISAANYGLSLFVQMCPCKISFRCFFLKMDGRELWKLWRKYVKWSEMKQCSLLPWGREFSCKPFIEKASILTCAFHRAMRCSESIFQLLFFKPCRLPLTAFDLETEVLVYVVGPFPILMSFPNTES